MERFAATEGVNREFVEVFADTVGLAHELLRSFPMSSQDIDPDKQKVIAALPWDRIIKVASDSYPQAPMTALVVSRKAPPEVRHRKHPQQ